MPAYARTMPSPASATMMQRRSRHARPRRSAGRFALRSCGPIEALEPRLVMAGGTAGTLFLDGATSNDPGTVTVNYHIASADLGRPVTLEIDRSADASGGAHVEVATATLPAWDLTIGAHTRTIRIPAGLAFDPSRPYVQVVADAGRGATESRPAIAGASFRILEFAAVI